MGGSVIAHKTVQLYGMDISRFHRVHAGGCRDDFFQRWSFPLFFLLPIQRSDQAALIQYVLHVLRQLCAGIHFSIGLSSSLRHMKNHGITGLHLVGKILADDGRKSDVDGIPEKIRAKDLAMTACTPRAFKTPGACSLEEPQPKFSPPMTKFARFYLFGEIRIQRLKCMALHLLQIWKQKVLGCDDLVRIQIVMKFEDRSIFP